MSAVDEPSAEHNISDDPSSFHDLSPRHDLSRESGLCTARSCVVVSDPSTSKPSSGAPHLPHPQGRALPVAKPPPGVSSAELATVVCRLETKELWERFHQLGTEMIITKSGRLVPGSFAG